MAGIGHGLPRGGRRFRVRRAISEGSRHRLEPCSDRPGKGKINRRVGLGSRL